VSLETLPPTATAFDAAAFDRCVMPTYGRFPLAIARGEGCRLWDTDGNSYLDFVAGIATCTLGHAHPAMVEAVTQQIQTLHHVSNLYYIPQQGNLAQWLTQNSCADFAFFCNSGAEANEGAIKLARKYAHTVLGIYNPVIITANASFHGRTLATVTATAQPKYQQNFSPLVPGFHYVPYNDIAALEAAIAELDASERQVAAILIQNMRKLCDQKGILLMLDEVQVGIGRSGHLWGYENLGIEPDIFTSAKGLAGGIPIGAMLCKSFCNVFTPGDHASTFGGNPFACAVALAVCQTLTQENLLANAQIRGEQLRDGLKAIAHQYPSVISDVRGWGLINGLEIAANVALTAPEIVKASMDKGLLLVPAGPKVVRFVPPLIVSGAEVEAAISILGRVFEDLIKVL
jgi:acetylornithine/N-succinyldiaminopimelate aminotransferase